jgi:FMN phosphatase YigB (HAD superfamily)
VPGAVGVTKAVLFDLYETLVTHFDPDWAPPPGRSLSGSAWKKPFTKNTGHHWTRPGKREKSNTTRRRWRGFARWPAGNRMPRYSRS